jgi:hypothetical protein
MTDVTTRIRNLSIALKAVSRGHQKHLADRIYALLQEEIKEAEKEEQRLTDTTTDDDISY